MHRADLCCKEGDFAAPSRLWATCWARAKPLLKVSPGARRWTAHGLFQALKPLVAPYLIGLFTLASFTFLSWPLAFGILVPSCLTAMGRRSAFSPTRHF